MFLCQQLQYYKQGKTDDFVKLLEASRTGMCLIIIINNNYKQGWALRKIEGSPELWNCEIQGPSIRFLWKKTKIFKLPKSKSKVLGVTRHC